jgi:hypothetical protein
MNVPPLLLRSVGRVLGKQEDFARLMNSLVVDDSRIRCQLSWSPPFELEQALTETVESYLTERRAGRS